MGAVRLERRCCPSPPTQTDPSPPSHSYVPVRVDYTDLWGIMAFFKGDLEGNGSHDHLAEKIATEGRRWAEQNWRWEDMQACEWAVCALFAALWRYQ